jgi:hypothetical protein
MYNKNPGDENWTVLLEERLFGPTAGVSQQSFLTENSSIRLGAF